MAKKTDEDKIVERHVTTGGVTWDKEQARNAHRPGGHSQIEDPARRAVAEEEREDAQRPRKDEDEAHGDAGIGR